VIAFVYSNRLEPWARAITYSAQVLFDEVWDDTQTFNLEEFRSLEEGRRRSMTLIVYYGDEEFSDSHVDLPILSIKPSGFFGPGYLNAPCPSPINLPRLVDTPVIFGGSSVIGNNQTLDTDADLLASSYFMTTRYEEVIRRETRDCHGRFPGRESLPFRAGFLSRPIVDEYTLIFRSWLNQLRVPHPERTRSFKTLLTHDVDYLGRYYKPYDPFRTLGSVLLGRQPIQRAAECLAVTAGITRDPFDTFDEMFEYDQQIDADVYYFFMAGGKSQLDGKYRIGWRRTKRLLQRCREAGAVVGLHTSYEASRNRSLIAKEKRKLEDVLGDRVHHNRHHILAWREPEDGWDLAAAGITWDSTLGYADVAGFRLGVCRPIPLFDPVSMQPFGIEEHPLIVMECTLDRPQYMGLDQDEAFCYCRDLIDTIRKHDGEFVVLWHNTAFATDPPSYQRDLYTQMLQVLDRRYRDPTTSFV
jgi:hypothetical protein